MARLAEEKNPMKYMLLICVDPTEVIEPSPGGMQIEDWVDEMNSNGIRLDGERLQAPSTAKTVRHRGGKIITTDGPFAETKEIMAGYDIIEAANLEQAIDVAAKHPMARAGLVEVRPFWVWAD